MTSTESPTTPRGVSGKKVLLISLIACVAIPFVAFFIPVLTIESRKEPAAALDWSQRESWEIVPTRPRVLRWGDTPRPPFEGREVKELPFDLPPGWAAQIQRLADLARNWEETVSSPEGFPRPTAGEISEFYGMYLLTRAPWPTQEYPESRSNQPVMAYAMAPKVLVWCFVDQTGHPLAHRDIGTIELVMVRLKDDVLDETVRLVYPDLTTDADGRVWLPVYDTVYSLGDGTRWADGLTVDHGLTQWFESPGQVGSLPDAVVRE